MGEVCQKCEDREAMEPLRRRSTGEEYWLCPSCLTEFGEWLYE